MSKGWINYVERLVTIKRTSIQDMTQFEILHLSGLLLSHTKDNSEGGAIWRERILNKDIMRAAEKWLISGEDEDIKLFIQSIKNSVIELFSPEINLMLENYIQKDKTCD